MENFEEAEYNFEEAYFLAPDDVEALLGLAKALNKLKDGENQEIIIWN